MVLGLDLFFSLLDKRDKRWLVVLGFVSAISGILEVLAISALMVIVVYAMQGKLPESEILQFILGLFNTQDISENILVIGIFLLGLYIFKNAFILLSEWSIYRYSFSVERKLSVKLFSNYLNLPYTFRSTESSSNMQTNLVVESNSFCNYYVISLISLMSQALTVLAILLWMLYQDYITFSIIFLVIILTVYINNKWSKNLINRKASLINKMYMDKTETITTAIHGFKETKIFGTQKYFTKLFNISTFSISKANAILHTVNKTPKASLEVVVVCTVLILMIFAIKAGETEKFFINISVFAFSLFRLLPSLIASGTYISILNRGKVSLKILAKELHKTDQLLKDVQKQDGSVIHFKEKIELNNIYFKYANSNNKKTEKWVLNGIDLTLEKNKMYALIGNSGGGKTTLVDIVTGLLEPSKGSVKVDGFDIHKSLESWWSHIGYIPQNIYLMNSTIRKNIAFGIKDELIDEEKIKQAIKIANLEEIVYSLKEGTNTVVGENGIQFSGGQRQRLGIARALYNNPDILILDEATASLDNISEFEIMDAIQKLSGKKTILIIAHRLSTIERCDKIFVINQGNIIEDGTYNDLAANSSIMKKMLNPSKKKTKQ